MSQEEFTTTIPQILFPASPVTANIDLLGDYVIPDPTAVPLCNDDYLQQAAPPAPPPAAAAEVITTANDASIERAFLEELSMSSSPNIDEIFGDVQDAFPEQLSPERVDYVSRGGTAIGFSNVLMLPSIPLRMSLSPNYHQLGQLLPWI